ncbi:MAG: hypothetical protein LBM93_07105 [Oscillospiraceae bacterium]|jgi:hypothetical protein|nr:hypothetical protein [Oscillospiraceae bacterium]
MKFKNGDTIKTLVVNNDIPIGCLGIVIYVFHDLLDTEYQVEFLDKQGYTVGVGTYKEKDIEKAE